MPIFYQANITGYSMSKQELHPITEKINGKQKAKAKLARFEALCWLSKTFPKAFDDSISIHPLKIGIMNDILAHADIAHPNSISKTKLREAVILFTRRIDYLACLKAREMRIDLEGNPTVQVTEEEAERAAVKIKKLIEKNTQIARENPPISSKTQLEAKPKLKSSSPFQLTQDSVPYANDMDYNPRYAAANAAPPRSSTVIIKHKATKAYDPDAVARLKEKLGLSKNPGIVNTP